MRQINVEKADFESCLRQAQQERLVITRKGKPMALLVGVEGMDREQLELGSSDRFWKLIAKRRGQKTMRRAGTLITSMMCALAVASVPLSMPSVGTTRHVHWSHNAVSLAVSVAVVCAVTSPFRFHE